MVCVTDERQVWEVELGEGGVDGCWGRCGFDGGFGVRAGEVFGRCDQGARSRRATYDTPKLRTRRFNINIVR